MICSQFQPESGLKAWTTDTIVVGQVLALNSGGIAYCDRLRGNGSPTNHMRS